MSPIDLPRPSDPELARMYEQAVYEHWLEAARRAMKEYPETTARLLAYVWHHKLIDQAVELAAMEERTAA